MEQNTYLSRSFPAEKIQRDLTMDVLDPALGDDFSCGNYAIQRETFFRIRHVNTGAWFTIPG